MRFQPREIRVADVLAPEARRLFLSLRFQVGRWQNSIPRFSLDPAGCMTLALSTMPAGSVLSPA